MTETIEGRSTTGGRLTLQGARTPAEGLWVTVDPRGGYAIVHEASGCAIGRCHENPEAALAAATEIGSLVDWSAVDGTRIQLPPETIRRIDAIVRRWGGNAITVGKPAA